jgi:hypothetical protein
MNKPIQRLPVIAALPFAHMTLRAVADVIEAQA